MARHGENIRKRTDGRWEGRYKTFDKNRGKYVYRSVYGRGYEEAKEKLAMVRFGPACHDTEEEKGTEGGSPKSAGGSGCAVSFSQAAREWLAELSGKRKYSTCIKYETVYRTHLAGIIGSCRKA